MKPLELKEENSFHMMIVFHSPYIMKERRNWWEYTVCSVQEGEKELEYLFYMAEVVEEMEEVGGRRSPKSI
jgi:hypothetical protein